MSDNEKDTSSTTSIPPLLLDDENNEGGNTLYKYRDFSTMPEEQDAEEDSNGNRNSIESSIRVQKFPVKLYAILAQKEFHDIITWMPHGRSWKVLKPNLFESMVMPLFFEYSNYHSFNRLVNAWSFRRISSGPDRGSYYHELFLRGKPHLQKYMRRLPKTHKKLPMKKEDEPNFYKMDTECSLPPLEEIALSAPKMNNGAGAMGAGMGGAGGMGGGLRGAGQQQGVSFSPVRPGQGIQGDNTMGRMFQPEGVNSHDGAFDGPDNFMGGRGQSRSPPLGGGNGMPVSMRDPTNFKNMEFKPVNMDGMGHHPGMGSQMMSQMGQNAHAHQMGGAHPGMMGSHQMIPQMMGSAAQQMSQQQAAMMGASQMGGSHQGMMSPAQAQMMGNPMASQMMNPQMMGQHQGMGQHQMGMGNLMGGAGGPGANSQQFYNLQRLRQAQQMQLFDRQMNAPVPVGAGGDEGFGRMGSYPRY